MVLHTIKNSSYSPRSVASNIALFLPTTQMLGLIILAGNTGDVHFLRLNFCFCLFVDGHCNFLSLVLSTSQTVYVWCDRWNLPMANSQPFIVSETLTRQGKINYSE